MHARVFHLADGHHAALQFALHGALVVDLFGKFAGAEVGLVEQFEADAAGFGLF